LSISYNHFIYNGAPRAKLVVPTFSHFGRHPETSFIHAYVSKYTSACRHACVVKTHFGVQAWAQPMVFWREGWKHNTIYTRWKQ